MGYRSEVIVSTTKKGLEELRKKYEEHIPEEYKEPSLFDSYLFNVVCQDEDRVVFGWNDVKWYEGYKDVQTVHKSLQAIDKEGIPYHFIRLGEGIGDVEEIFSETEDTIGLVDIYVSQSIDIGL